MAKHDMGGTRPTSVRRIGYARDDPSDCGIHSGPSTSSISRISSDNLAFCRNYHHAMHWSFMPTLFYIVGHQIC